ncbi:F0F1 ATP synthase subunit A [Lujinxingia vulgaris]|uniref:ATP synthase subunit a n=1 Tax=Lujinxingia vulgaris TaxID=2600176 RepID=A0A5C6XT36_9DELT|nr:F0F1 ATP synthase subunit A [Lujinxingia vulgaris]TXD43501.1 F0F1 ATP synthase subunit A [Lujinxingia vulgaris]
MADYTFLDLIPAFAEQEHGEGWNHIFGDPLLNPAGTVTATHVVFTGVLVVLITVLALIARRKYSNRDEALVPVGKFSVTGFFEVLFDAVMGMMSDLMGEKAAKKFFPLIASLAVYIYLGNLMGLVVGFAPPTSNLNTGLACAIVVFLVYNVSGFMEQGMGYIKHFMGPILLLAPLIFIIELVGHAFRPVSLSVRLTGNMTGDHMVLGVFGDLASGMFSIPILIPVPFLFLGLLVCTIQALVFCLLSSIYIALAIEHEDH